MAIDPRTITDKKLKQAIEAASPNAWLDRLMSRSKISMNWRVEPEQKFAIDLADRLRRATIEGRLKCVWCHVPNEGKRHQIVALIMRAMGMLSGAPDFWFISKDGGAVIELKFGSNDLTDSQKDFMQWCRTKNVTRAISRAVTISEIPFAIDGIIMKLTEWGLYE